MFNFILSINKLKKYLRIDFDKNTKFIFYLKGLWIFLAPKSIYKKDLEGVYQKLSEDEKRYIEDRVSYYNKLKTNFTLPSGEKTIKEFRKKEKKKTYFFDLLEYLNYFDFTNKISYLFGDIIEVPKYPAIVKSRPISENNQNSIIMNLNKVRHFIFVNDYKKFEEKKNMLAWRGKVHQEHRKFFMGKFFKHPLCNIGQINNKKNNHTQWQKEKLSLREHLDYKFLLAIEGNDVASNLKWAMSSNSLVLMVKPKYETWFMEGRLIPNYHFILIEDDYSDFIEKLEYYSKHTNEAIEIIKNANEYISQFKNKEREDIISFLTLNKYFIHSNQI
ncbi:MAG: glycosyl transferase family 90 [Sulfurovum sp.]